MTALLLALVLLLSGCNEVSVSDNISQRQANQIVVALSAFGIPAEVEKSGRGQTNAYSVLVRRRNYAEALRIIEERNLPSKPDESLQDLIAQKGLMPNPREIEALRTDRAMSKELEDLLENHAGVASAKAVVRKFAAGEGAKPGVSLVLQLREEGKLSKEEVVPLLQKVVPNIAAEDVNVIFSTREQPRTGGEVVGVIGGPPGQAISLPLVPFLLWRVPAGDRYGLAFGLLGLLVATAIVGVAAGFALASIKAARQMRAGELLEAGPQPGGLRYEKGRNDLLGA